MSAPATLDIAALDMPALFDEPPAAIAPLVLPDLPLSALREPSSFLKE